MHSSIASFLRFSLRGNFRYRKFIIEVRSLFKDSKVSSFLDGHMNEVRPQNASVPSTALGRSLICLCKHLFFRDNEHAAQPMQWESIVKYDQISSIRIWVYVKEACLKSKLKVRSLKNEGKCFSSKTVLFPFLFHEICSLSKCRTVFNFKLPPPPTQVKFP